MANPITPTIAEKIVTTDTTANSLVVGGASPVATSGTGGIKAGPIVNTTLTASGNISTSAGTVADSVGTMTTIRAGGIGIASQAANDMVYASSATQLARVANASTTGHVWTATSGGAPGWAAPAAGVTASFSTIFENAVRTGQFEFSSGVLPVIGQNGILCDTSAARGSSGAIWHFALLANGLGPGFSLWGSFAIGTKGTHGTVFIGNTDDAGISVGTDTGSMTPKHWGFKAVWNASSAIALSATQSDGTTESATVLDAAVVAGSTYTVFAVVNAAGTGITYYYWKDGGARSAGTTITANFPTGVGRALESSITDNATSTLSTAIFHGAGISNGG